MAASNIPVGNTGEKLQTWENTIGADDVHAEAVVLVDSSGVEIATLPVSVSSIVPGTGATNLGKAEDAGHTSGDVGVMMLGVRNDSLATLAGADLDYCPIAVDSRGVVTVGFVSAININGGVAVDAAFAGSGYNPIVGAAVASTAVPSAVSADGDVVSIWSSRIGGLNTHLRDLAGDSCMDEALNALQVSIVAGAGSGGTAAADDADFVAGTTQGTPAMGVYESAPTSVTDGDLGTVGITQTRALRTAVEGTVTVGSHAVTNAGTFAVQDATAQASLSVIDDWDESDRAKVNIIVGQAGVAAGAGAVGATVQRVTLASDDPAVAALQILDNIVAGSEAQVDIVAALPAGTNAIGKLAANSGVDIGDVDVTSQPARVRTTDTISAALATDAIMQGTTARTPAFAIIDAATSGDNTLLAAQGASNKIRVHQLYLVSAGTVNVRFESGAGGTALSGQMNLVANTGFVLPFSPIGWFETAANTLLNLELSAAISVDGGFAYTVVT